MQRVLVRCAALWIMGLSCTARADPVVQGLLVATLGTIVGQALGKAPSREDRACLMVEGGRFDVVPNASNRTAANQLELAYRPGRYLVWKLKPLVGLGATATSSFYGYAGLRLDTFWGPHVVIAPSFALTAYARQRGKDLGTPPLLGRSASIFSTASTTTCASASLCTTCPMANCSDRSAIPERP